MSESFEAARQLFLQGVAHFEVGDAAAAERCFQASLVHLPGRPSALMNLGVARLRLARPAEALQPLEAALAGDATLADAWGHHAVACSELGRDEAALHSLQQARALGCTLPALPWHEAVALNRLGRHAPARVTLQRLLLSEPEHAPAWMLLGQTLQALHDALAARAAYERAVVLQPDLAPAWMHLGLLLKDLDQEASALAALQQARLAGGDAALLDFFGAALAGASAAPGSAAPGSAPPAYVRGLFDTYAPDFETHLVSALHYRGHLAVTQAAAACHRGGAALALDLGCGSGLCGPLLRPLALRVEGVDLSPSMVRQTQACGAYDAVHETDLVAHLQRCTGALDIVVAADVFIYLGELDAVFSALARLLAPGGVFAFTAEHAKGPAPWILQPSLRYAHSEVGLRDLAARHQLRVLVLRAETLREEQGEPVVGWVVVLGAAG